MDKRLIEVYDRMTMPDDCTQRIERKMQRALGQRKGGGYTMELQPNSRKQGWGIAAALVCLVLILSVGCVSLFLKASETVASVNATAPEETASWQEFSDSEVRFVYPQGWSAAKDGDVTTFYDTAPEQRPVMRFERTRGGNMNLSTELYVLRESIPGVEVLESKPLTVGGEEALRMVYTYAEGNTHYTVVRYSMKANGVGHRLYFYPPEEDAGYYDAVEQEVVASLEYILPIGDCSPQDYTYTKNSDGTITIATYLGNGENIRIPDQIDGRHVTAISEAPGYYPGDPGAFSDCDTVRTVTIPEGVTRIGDNSFTGCVSLQTVKVPASVKEIGSGAFSDCPSLQRVIFAGNAPAYGNFVFDSTLNVSVVYREGTSGWEETWAGRPVLLLDNEEPDLDSFTLTDQGRTFLEKMCYYMPDWSGYAALNDSFWREFLFRSFTCPEMTDNETVMTVWGEQALVTTPWGQAVKVSRGQTVEPYVRLAMGCEMPAFAPAAEDMEPGQTPFYYDREDGCYYIGLSDFGDIGFSLRGCYPYREAYGICVNAAFDVYSGEPENMIGGVGFTLEPRDNENGFTIVGKYSYHNDGYDDFSDRQNIAMTVWAFYDAYFAGDTEQMKAYLANPDSGSVKPYGEDGGENVVVNAVKGLPAEEEFKQVGDTVPISVEFLQTQTSDSFTYLTLELVKQENGWRVASYGLEK